MWPFGCHVSRQHQSVSYTAYSGSTVLSISLYETMGPNPSTTTSSMLLPPRLIVRKAESSDSLECSCHTLPKPLIREFSHVFGNQYLQDEKVTSNSHELLAIPTNQCAKEDLVAIGDQIEQEKDRLLNVFMDFAKDFCQKIRREGYWADYIDPCSGLPMLTRGCNKVYSEVDGMECLLNYKSYNAGFCKILMHPQFGSAVYPATIFAHAPAHLVIELLQTYPSATTGE